MHNACAYCHVIGSATANLAPATKQYDWPYQLHCWCLKSFLVISDALSALLFNHTTSISPVHASVKPNDSSDSVSVV